MTRILGQRAAIGTLSKALASGHVHHAWIFHGPLGVGKFTTALEFAKLLLDPSVTDGDRRDFAPPLSSRVAALVAGDTHPDLHIVRKERAESSEIASVRDKKQTNIPIDLLRELMLGGVVDGRTFEGAVWRTAYLGHGKVFIIDEAELLDSVGQNALLKTLEEPPPHTHIVLVTTREDRLLPTIRSRCQRVAFAPLDGVAMQAWFDGASLPDLTPADRMWLQRFADGSPGWATLVATHGVHLWAKQLSKPLEELSRGRFVPTLADEMNGYVSECSEAIVKANAKASKEAANRLGIKMLLGLLGQHVRDGVAAAAEGGDLPLAEAYARLADVLADADEAIRRHLNQKHVLANLVAQWCLRAPRASGALA